MKVLIDDLGCYFISDKKMYRSGCFSFKEGYQLTDKEIKKFSVAKIRFKENDLGKQKTKQRHFTPKKITPQPKKRSWL
jgi:hypothetical protein